MKKDATTFPRFHFLVAYLNGCIMEIWKDVPGYIGLYKVSNYGRVKSVKKQLVLKTCGSGNRYKTVALCNGMRKTFRVHRLVAAAFIPNPDNKPCIDHIDGDRIYSDIEPDGYVTDYGNKYPLLRINDVANSDAMLEFAVIGQMYDVLNLSYVGRMKG